MVVKKTQVKSFSRAKTHKMVGGSNPPKFAKKLSGQRISGRRISGPSTSGTKKIKRKILKQQLINGFRDIYLDVDKLMSNSALNKDHIETLKSLKDRISREEFTADDYETYEKLNKFNTLLKIRQKAELLLYHKNLNNNQKTMIHELLSKINTKGYTLSNKDVENFKEVYNSMPNTEGFKQTHNIRKELMKEFYSNGITHSNAATIANLVYRQRNKQNVSREYGDLLTSQQKYFNRYLYGNRNKNMTTYGNSPKSNLSKHKTSEPLYVKKSEPLYVNTTGWQVNPKSEEGKQILRNSQTAILKRLKHSVHE